MSTHIPIAAAMPISAFQNSVHVNMGDMILACEQGVK